MEKAAIAAALSVRYVGAGTVEFLLDENGEDFYFLEMNTRLQVEHPVTELVRRIDLVAWQLILARDGKIDINLDDISPEGHAIEVRIYAEDAFNDFLPSTGKLHKFNVDSAIRADAGVRSGDVITPYNDPMLAKLIAFGDTRDDALLQLRQALDKTAVLGVTTNLPFLRTLLEHPTVRDGATTTTFLDETYPDGPPEPAITTQTIALAAALFLRGETEAFAAHSSLRDTALLGFSSDGGLPIPLDLSLNSQLYSLTATGVGTPLITITGEGFAHQVTHDLRIDGLRQSPHHAPDGTGGLYLQTTDHHLHVLRAQPWEKTNTTASGALTAPMPGLLVALNVTAGDTVKKGDTLAVLEAMKMQHQLTAATDGVVAALHVAAGQQLSKGALILTMEDPT